MPPPAARGRWGSYLFEVTGADDSEGYLSGSSRRKADVPDSSEQAMMARYRELLRESGVIAELRCAAKACAI